MNEEKETKTKISRQLKWQIKKRQEGLCSICGKRPLTTKNHCGECGKYSRKRNLKYYLDHTESCLQYGKKYYQEHKRYFIEYNKSYRETNKEQLREKKKQYYQEHKEYYRKYYRDHEEYFKEYRIKRKEEMACQQS